MEGDLYMIQQFLVGDITDPSNHRHIIIGMNTTLDDVVGIGVPYAAQLKNSLTHPLTPGSVLSFRFDEKRNLHMLICHDIGYGGWKRADEHVRFGLDYLRHTDGDTGEFSIVQIGTGEIGLRDGADPIAIRTAMANSFLPVTLFIRDDTAHRVAAEKPPLHMVAYAAWTPGYGREEIHRVS